jgi:nucleotide-binding universal stress UspA family protein
MKRLNKILVPTDLTENSRRGLVFGSWLAGEERAAMVVLHVASEFNAWELYSEEVAFMGLETKRWPLDRVLAEATLDLNRFLEPSLQQLRKARATTKRVVLGAVASQVAAVAEEEEIDLVIMSPRRRRGWRHLFSSGITDQVTRVSPCPVLSVTQPLPSNQWRGKSASVLFGWPRPRVASA